MKISIISAIFGVEKYIEQFALSLFEQSVTKNIEFIFVNDNTIDHSMDILYDVLSRYPHLQNQVKIINHERNRGLASARLTGLEHSVGEFVWFVDSDDWLEKNAVGILLKLLKDKNNFDVVWFSGIYHGQREHEIRTKVTPETLLTSLTWPTLWCCIINRQFLYANHILPIEGLNYGEDRIMTSRIVCVAKNTIQLAARLYHYRTDNNCSYSNTVKPAYLLQDAIGGTIVHKFYLEHNNSGKYWPALFINQAIRYYNISKSKEIDAANVQSQLLSNMFHDSFVMTVIYFLVGWVLPVRYRVTLLYYFRKILYSKIAIPINN